MERDVFEKKDTPQNPKTGWKMVFLKPTGQHISLASGVNTYDKSWMFCWNLPVVVIFLIRWIFFFRDPLGTGVLNYLEANF